MTTINGCINYLRDEMGNCYYIPNFCINDPFFEKQFTINEQKPPEIKTINLLIYDLYENKTSNLEVFDNITGLELKHKYLKSVNLPIEQYKLRMFFGGVEIKDEQLIYQHNLKDEYKIQISKVKLG
jgi:hypothetical protein